MASQEELLSALKAIKAGDLSQKLAGDGEAAATINDLVDDLNQLVGELKRVAREIGEGQLGCQAVVPNAEGVWKGVVEDVNSMARNLTNEVRDICTVITAHANGDLTRGVTVNASGEFAELKTTINLMTDGYNRFADEVTRVARELGTEGMFGCQAEVPHMEGTWKDLVANINFMAANLTCQVRDIARTTKAVAEGKSTQKATAHARGETLEIRETLNQLVDKMASSN